MAIGVIAIAAIAILRNAVWKGVYTFKDSFMKK
jgi:hypothetical protein